MKQENIFNVAKKLFSKNELIQVSNFLFSSLNSESFAEKKRVFKLNFSKINPEKRFLASLYELALKLANQQKYQEAYFIFKFLTKSIKDNFIINLNIAKVFIILSKYELAEKYLKISKQLNENSVEVLFNLGLVYQRKGKIKLSEEYFIKIISLNPYHVESYRHLGMSYKCKNQNDKFLLKMKKIINDESFKLNSIQKSQICFSISKAYDDLRLYKDAFEYIEKGNKFKRETLNYSDKNTFNQFESLKKASKLLKKKHRIYKGEFINISPIFIVGMPRSGTTLLENIISMHSKIVSLGEPLIFPEAIKKNFPHKNLKEFELYFEEISDKHVKKFRGVVINEFLKRVKLSNALGFTDKLPFNFKYISLINTFIPEAKIIHIKRSPQDTCLSILKNYFYGEWLGFTNDQKELASYYRYYQDFIEFLKNEKFNFFEVEYEQLVTNMDNELQNIFNYLDIPYEDNVLKYYESSNVVSTLSSFQVRQKSYTTSIDSWKNYKDYLIEEIKNL